MKKIVKDVVGALIEREGKFLVARRKPEDTFGGLWEFPGGCVEHNEDKKDALKREIREELGIDVEVERLAYECEDEIPTLKIHIYLYGCRIIAGEPKPVDCAAVSWATLDELRRMDLAPADKKIADWLEGLNKKG
ncbi:MAG: (deoxy)nucleoside triphosphate pyrophosphohydrolase [Candidatus Omnitrophica bacterium]|nr:(deoxy)nucleoside triphosphate pyrophosphohydrolase [Candidatus Omnitrophota bacterium]